MSTGAKRFPFPLHVTIPVLVFAFSTCFITVTSYLIYKRSLVRETDRQLGVASAQAARLGRELNRRAGNTSNSSFQEELALLGTDSWVHWAAVCTVDGFVAHSTNTEQIGRTLEAATSQKVAAEAMLAFKTKGMRTLLRDPHTALVVYPVLGGRDGPVRWLVLVERDLKDFLERERETSVANTVFASMLLLASCLGLWLALHWFLARRVQQLLTQIRGPQMSAIDPLTGSDEFAEISRAYWESETLLRQVTENIHDVFYMLAIEPRRLIYVSPAYEEVWGLKSENVLAGRLDFLEIVFEEYRHALMTLHGRVEQGEDMVQLEYRIRHPEGKIRWLETKVFPVKDVHGKVYRIAGMTTNITLRKELEQTILDIAERERRGIGHDLHDDLCQRLAAFKLHGEMTAFKVRQGKAVDPEELEKISVQLGDAANHCRNIARTLSPVNLEGDGLMHALSRLVQTASSSYGVQCYFDCPEPLLMGNNNTANHLYRIAQELINNAVRHAKPSTVNVHLTREGQSVRLVVANDGGGFDEPAQEHEGMGLRIIRYRANAIGGTVEYLKSEDNETRTVAVCLVSVSACDIP